MSKRSDQHQPFSFTTKAETLRTLSAHITKADVNPFKIFKVSDWRKQKKKIIRELQSSLSADTVIVRSSAVGEDGADQSYAGHFTSVAHVPLKSGESIKKAVDEVIKSYGQLSGDHQFFVQEQVKNIKVSGVLFTCDIDSLAPYYIVSYDDSGSHESVTSGGKADIKTYVRAHCSPHPPENVGLERVIDLAKELEEVTGEPYLDIEFAIDQNDTLYLLQVRPIAIGEKSPLITRYEHQVALKKIEKKAEKLTAPHPGLAGKCGVYSVMTDWNPAEMIGRNPRRLALSLYKELITDSTWAYQRDNYGYRNLRSFPLLISFLEQPYIDVRVSFNSFVPKVLDESLVEKLVDYYTEKLIQNPSEHDKVEFSILHSCYYLKINEKLKELLDHGFTELDIDRIKFSLLDLTNTIVHPDSGLYRNDLLKIEQLESLCREVTESNLSLIDKIYWLIQHCKRYGTLPFAGLARAGFIAVQFLRSMVESDILSVDEHDSFLGSLHTVGKEIAEDTARWERGEITKEAFVNKYGHLRPGTYDILSRRYDESFDDYFSRASEKRNEAPKSKASFSLTNNQTRQLNQELLTHGLKISAEELMTFITEAIEGREYGKFVFTKVLSQILQLVEQLGARHHFTRDQMSWVDIKTIIDLYSNLTMEDLSEILRSDITRHKRFYEMSSSLKLPQLIRSTEDIYDFYISGVEPNFVTRGRVTEVLVTEEDLHRVDLSEKIVFIKQADPGYDWIFSKNIAGLVTMYGGANSHMAIRCSELQIPAVIGCGEKNYEEWSQADLLAIDCAKKQVHKLDEH